MSLPLSSLCSFHFSALSFIFPITFTYSGVQSDCSAKTHNVVLYICVFVQKGYYVWNKKQLLSLNPNNVNYLLGEFLVLASL